jgi:ferredoxin
MKLSEINTSVYYEAEIPSLKKKVSFRPFTVKEEKALLTAEESEDIATMLATLNQIVAACIVNCPPNLTTFDVEYMFIKIRGKSVGEDSQIIMKCVHCGSVNHVNVDLNTVKLSTAVPDRKIIINNQLAVVMRYPTLEDTAKITKCAQHEQVETAIAISIETIYFGDKVFHTAEADMSDVVEFILNRTDAEMEPLIKFVETIPTIELPIEFECRQCMKENKTVINSITDFF